MILLYSIVALALVFDFINGFHDAANSIATVVSTKVLSPLQAVLWAAFFNVVAGLLFELHVATTVGKGIVHTEVVSLVVIAGGLTGAIIWNLLTWWWGLPSSSSHALVGGFAGAAVAKAGIHAVIISGIMKIVLFIFLSPIIGLILAYIISMIVVFICRKMTPYKVDKYFRKFQLVSAAAYSIGHGANDAQKVMGIIFVALVVSNQVTKNDSIPIWVVFSCYSAIGLGTLFGGWRIVKTMGQRITKLKPFEGFCAETAGAATLFSTGILGIPVSTTHTITGSIVGVGMQKRISAVHWGVTKNVIWAWIFTIPITALMGAIIYYILNILI